MKHLSAFSIKQGTHSPVSPVAAFGHLHPPDHSAGHSSFLLKPLKTPSPFLTPVQYFLLSVRRLYHPRLSVMKTMLSSSHHLPPTLPHSPKFPRFLPCFMYVPCSFFPPLYLFHHQVPPRSILNNFADSFLPFDC